MNTAKQIKKSNQTNSQVALGQNLMLSLYLYNRSAANLMFLLIHCIGNTLYMVSQFIRETGNKVIQVLWNIQGAVINRKKVFCYVRDFAIASIHMDLGVTLLAIASIHMDLPYFCSSDPKSTWINSMANSPSHQSTWIYHISAAPTLNPHGLPQWPTRHRINPLALLRCRAEMSFS